MQILLYKANKAKNSTFRPSGGASHNCSLKDGCDISTPELIFTAVSNAHEFNYAYIPTFKRFYFINEWTYERGEWMAQCSIDVLATWKLTIGASNQYIVRSAKAGEVIDDLIFPTVEDTYREYNCNNVISDTGTAADPTAGLYFVKTATTSNIGIQSGVAVYAMTAFEFRQFVDELSTTEYMNINTEIDKITDNVAKLLLNPAQYIISAKYVPISKYRLEQTGVVFSEAQHILYGWYELNATASMIKSYPRAELNIYNGIAPRNSYSTATTDCYNKQFLSEKYTTFKLEYPMLGVVDIPNDYLIDCDWIYIYVYLDLMDLTALTMLSTFDYPAGADVPTLKRANLPLAVNNWGIDIPINNFMRDVRQEISSVTNLGANILSSVGNLLSGNLIGAASNAVSTLSGAVDVATANMNTSVHINGSSGGYASLTFNRKIHVYTKVPSYTIPPRTIGKSTMKYGQISTYAVATNGSTHLTICQAPIINNINTNEPKYLGDEYDQLINYMSQGFYYD